MNFGSTIFQKWTPIEDLGIGYDVDDICWGADGITFTLIPDGVKKKGYDHGLKLVWESSHIISYHVTDETYRADCWGLDFEKNGRFYMSKESQYIDLLKSKSPLFPESAIHFAIIGTNTVVDVLAKDYPTIKVIANE